MYVAGKVRARTSLTSLKRAKVKGDYISGERWWIRGGKISNINILFSAFRAEPVPKKGCFLSSPPSL